MREMGERYERDGRESEKEREKEDTEGEREDREREAEKDFPLQEPVGRFRAASTFARVATTGIPGRTSPRGFEVAGVKLNERD